MKQIWEKWKIIAEKIGNFQIKVVFSLLYFVLVLPIGFVSSHLTDFLNIKRFPQWEEFKDTTSTINKLKKQ